MLESSSDRIAARKLIEEGLIFEEEERRLTLYEGQIFKTYGISPELLRKLLDTHLIRSEPSLRGGYTYELSHDTLVAPVLKAKKKRLENERLVREAQEEMERAKALNEALAQAEKERKLRERAEANEKKALNRTRLAIFIALLAIAASVFAFFQYRSAQNSLNQYLEEQAAKNRLRVEQLLIEVETYIKAEEMPSAKAKLEEIFEIDPDNVEARELEEQMER